MVLKELKIRLTDEDVELIRKLKGKRTDREIYMKGLDVASLRQGHALAEHADFMFDAVIENVSGLSGEQLNWKPIEDTKDIETILTHTTRIALILIPQVIDGTVNPEGWDDDYENIPHTYEELLKDLNEARKIVVDGIRGLDEKELEAELELWGRKLVKKNLLFHLLREIVHHSGQIAMLKGMHKRSTA